MQCVCSIAFDMRNLLVKKLLEMGLEIDLCDDGTMAIDQNTEVDNASDDEEYEYDDNNNADYES